MACITVRGCRIGEGRPKIILPIVEQQEAAVLERGKAFAALPIDCVEFRATGLRAGRMPTPSAGVSPAAVCFGGQAAAGHPPHPA